MALLREFRAVADGEWVSVLDDRPELQIKTRGMTNIYRNALAQLKRTRAMTVNRQNRGSLNLVTEDNLLPSDDDSCVAECLNAHCLLDVRGLESAPGVPVTIDQLRELIMQEDYRDLLFMVQGAALIVSKRREATQDDATKNSSTALSGT